MFRKIIGSLVCLLVLSFSSVYAGINDGMVAYYPFDGNAIDASGQGHDGIEHNGVSYSEGILGQAASFDGFDDFIKVASEDFKLRPLTLSMWVKSVNSKTAWFLGFENGNARYGWDLENFQDRVVFRLKAHNGGSKAHTTSTYSVTDGDWHLITVTDDGSSLSLYIDGAFDSSASSTTPSWITGMRMHFGSARPETPWPHAWFNGQIDDARIYGRVLSEEEVMELYDSIMNPVPELTFDEIMDERVAELGLAYDATGSIHAYPNLLWPPNNKDRTIILEGYFIDKLAMLRFGGTGVSDAYAMVDGSVVDLTWTEIDGKFTYSAETTVKAVKGADYSVELYVIDSAGNTALVDSTHISVPGNMSNKKK